jgi:hemerythrin-like domain-containing protein
MCDHCGCRTLTPIARLMAEHDRLRELTGVIRQAVDRADDAAARTLFDELLVVLGPHVRKEEATLFPMLSREEELTGHVAQLEDEHAGLYDAVDDLAEPATGGPWRNGVLAVLHELDEHMFKEDFGLFPAAIATLDGADWDAMDRWELESGVVLPETAPAR